MEVIKIILRLLFLGLLPAGLLHLGKEATDFTALYSWWYDMKPPLTKEQIEGIGQHQGVFFYCVLVVTSFFVPLKHEVTVWKNRKTLSSLLGVVADSKELLAERCKVIFAKPELALNVRVFLRRKRNPWQRIRKAPVFFDHVELKDLAIHKIGEISWEVYPKQEGIVGLVAHRQEFQYDLDPQSAQRGKMFYNMSAGQYATTKDTHFVAGTPVFDAYTKRKVIAVVTYDSKQQVAMDANQRVELESLLGKFSATLHKHLAYIKS